MTRQQDGDDETTCAAPACGPAGAVCNPLPANSSPGTAMELVNGVAAAGAACTGEGTYYRVLGTSAPDATWRFLFTLDGQGEHAGVALEMVAEDAGGNTSPITTCCAKAHGRSRALHGHRGGRREPPRSRGATGQQPVHAVPHPGQRHRQRWRVGTFPPDITSAARAVVLTPGAPPVDATFCSQGEEIEQAGAPPDRSSPDPG